MHTTSVHRRAPSRWALLAVTASVAAVTLSACGGGSQGSSTVAAAQSAAARISQAAASGATAASSADSTSGSDSGNYSNDDSPPCNLVTKEQLASITHVPYTNNEVVLGQCLYTRGDDPSSIYTIGTDDKPGCWASTSTIDGAADGTAPVSGVGDAAFGTSTGLDVEHGSTCITVGGSTAAEKSGDWSTDVAVATIVLGKLG